MEYRTNPDLLFVVALLIALTLAPTAWAASSPGGSVVPLILILVTLTNGAAFWTIVTEIWMIRKSESSSKPMQ